MTCFYWSPPDAAYFAKHPFKRPEDFPEPECEVWDENWAVFEFYRDFHDQWRVGPFGPFALDLGFFVGEMKEMGIGGEERAEWLNKLRIIANQAKKEMNQ